MERDEENIIVRDFSPDEYDDLVKLWSAASLPFRPEGRDSRKNLTAELNNGPGRLLIAELEAKMAGSLLVTHDGRKGWINRLAVLPGLRRRGIAARLVEEAQSLLEQEGIEITAVLIEGDNPESKKLFEALGFVRHPDIAYYSRRKHPGV
jgi:ribosomal protein S18 acetylase RimI-like enzyme